MSLVLTHTHHIYIFTPFYLSDTHQCHWNSIHKHHNFYILTILPQCIISLESTQTTQHLHIIYFTSVTSTPYHWNPHKQHNFNILSYLPQCIISLEFHTQTSQHLHVILFTSVTLLQYHWYSNKQTNRTNTYTYIPFNTLSKQNTYIFLDNHILVLPKHSNQK